MKRLITLFLAVASLGATLLGALAWFNNICVTRLWYRDLIAADWNKTTTVGQVYQGPINWLNWSAVDLSTVTTFIPFFGSLLIFLGFIAILRGKEITNADFPFFRAYDRVTVSLGLIGTLWGIIVIGYYPIKSIKMSILMLSLHTALFSTLMAVAWVFIVVLLIVKPFMQWWARYLRGEHPDDTGEDLITVFEKLRLAAGDSGRALSDNSHTVEKFSQALNSTQEIVMQFGAELKQHSSTIVSAEETILKLLSESRQERDAQLTLLKQLAGIVERVDNSQQEIMQRLTRIEQENRQLQERNSGLEQENQQLQSERDVLRQTLTATDEKLARIKTALE